MLAQGGQSTGSELAAPWNPELGRILTETAAGGHLAGSFWRLPCLPFGWLAEENRRGRIGEVLAPVSPCYSR